MQYIREKDLWSPASYIASLTARLEATPDDASLYVERASGTTAATNGEKPSTTSTGHCKSIPTTGRPGNSWK